ncbi:MAG: multicopper oxidase family protein, partial [Candidatus Angelobacter sp.]
PYKGIAGRPGHPALPPDMQLWPQNESEIKDGLWPQFHMGAFPYCFKLPVYDPAKVVMGQSPGTHWYHAHKHGSTALNVANGMTGVFIIEGKYDDDLHKFYGPNLREKVMMLQQLSTAPFPVLDPNESQGGPGAPRAVISINGRRNPVVTMNPGEVQLWRIVNGAFRDAVQFLYFTEQGGQQPCSKTGTCVDWRQIAQDGVQLTWQKYNSFGAMDSQLNLAPANRADLLVRAPSKPGVYVLQALANEGIPLQANDTSYEFPLLTVKVVNGQSMGMNFIEKEHDFPTFPEFLKDIPETDIFNTRKIVFASNHKQIDGASFDPHKINQAVLLNTSEEWTVLNQATDKAHPFHIHVNPFQITAIFEPNSKESSDPKNPCYADPTKPETWKPCKPVNPPFVWWDTFAIPTARQDTLPANVCTSLSACPAAIQPYTTCSKDKCAVTIAGYFKMRSRFVDFPGQFVLHCHILIHEDRGMMQMVSVCPNTTKYVHQ